MEEMILRSYRAGVEGVEGEERRKSVVEEFQRCVSGKRKETDKYWKSILDIAKQQLKQDDDEEEEEEDSREEKESNKSEQKSKEKAEQKV